MAGRYAPNPRVRAPRLGPKLDLDGAPCTSCGQPTASAVTTDGKPWRMCPTCSGLDLKDPEL